MPTPRISIESVVVGLLVTSAPVIAEAATDTGATDLETVIVTASKREEALKDVPMSVTALSGTELDRWQQTQLSDFASQVPGMSLQQPNPGQTRLVLRGLNVGSVGSTVATVIDDIPFSMSGAQANGAFFAADVDTYDMNRIEVLRGPQGTLYGATAEGGLIKYVTNAPNLNAFEARVDLGGSTIDGGSTAGSAKGMINLPFWSNKAALRVSAVKEGIPGYIDDPTTGATDINHGSKYSIRASLLVKPVDQFSARFTFFDQGLEVRTNNFSEVVGAAADPAHPPADQFSRIGGDFINNSPWPHEVHYDMRVYGLNLQYDFSAASLMSSTSYGEIQNRFAQDLTNNNVAPGITYSDLLGLFIGVYNQPIVVAERQLEFVHKFNQELRLASRPGSSLFGHDFDWLGGLFFTRESTVLNQFLDARDPADTSVVLQPPLGGANIPADYKEKAVFADFTYHFTTAFDLALGGRYSHTDQSSNVQLACCVLYGPGVSFPAIETSEHSTTWSVAPRFHLSQDSMLYARYSTGYRPGGPNLPTPTLPNPPPLAPDSTRNYELGFKSDLLNHRFSFDIAVFDIDWKDVQILSIVNTPAGPVGINGNSGSARNVGVEWNFSWQPVNGLTLGLLGSYVDAKITEDAPGLGAFNGDKLPYVPDLTATLNATYNWHAFGNFTGFVGGSWNYVGNAYTNFATGAATESHAKMPSYDLLRLNLGFENDHYSFELYGENVGNSRGITDYANNGGVNQRGLANFLQPRTIGVQLGAKF